MTKPVLTTKELDAQIEKARELKAQLEQACENYLHKLNKELLKECKRLGIGTEIHLNNSIAQALNKNGVDLNMAIKEPEEQSSKDLINEAIANAKVALNSDEIQVAVKEHKKYQHLVVLKQKITAVESLKNCSLNEPHTFKNQLESKKNVILANNDHAGKYFLKVALSIITGGLAAVLGIFVDNKGVAFFNTAKKQAAEIAHCQKESEQATCYTGF